MLQAAAWGRAGCGSCGNRRVVVPPGDHGLTGQACRARRRCTAAAAPYVVFDHSSAQAQLAAGQAKVVASVFEAAKVARLAGGQP